MKWILCYLRSASDVSLVFQKRSSDDSQLVDYVDSDYAGDLDKRRSLTGYVFTFSNCVISWKVVLQSTVALSTTEAQYMAVAERVKEVLWLRGLVNDLCQVQEMTSVYYDS